MSAEHYVVLGVARVRSAWFGQVSRWATAAALPVDFVKCISVDEVRARLAGARPFSALLVDGSLPDLDRDLVDQARAIGCAVIAVDDGRSARDWLTLGVSSVLAEPLERDTLLHALRDHAPPVGQLEIDLTESLAGGEGVRGDSTSGWRGRLVAVTGGGGTGASTLAAALAQALSSDARHGGLVLLADLALEADHAVLHDVGDVVPGVQELVEAQRSAQLTPEEVRAHLFSFDDRGYQLLLGLRRRRDWAALRPRAVELAIDSLLRTFRLVVADVDGDLEGEADCGSLDVEERNVLARAGVRRADVVVVTAHAGVAGLHRLVRVIDGLFRFGVDAHRILPVVNRAPRTPRARAEIASAVAKLTAPLHDEARDLPTPLFTSERRRLDDRFRDGVALPRSFVTPLAAAVEAMLDRVSAPATTGDLVPITPGSLGAWSDE